MKRDASAKTGFHSLFAALQASYRKTDKDPGLSATLADLDKFEFPAGFLATLNDKGEVKIGNEIIWYRSNLTWHPVIPCFCDPAVENGMAGLLRLESKRQ